MNTVYTKIYFIIDMSKMFSAGSAFTVSLQFLQILCASQHTYVHTPEESVENEKFSNQFLRVKTVIYRTLYV